MVVRQCDHYATEGPNEHVITVVDVAKGSAFATFCRKVVNAGLTPRVADLARSRQNGGPGNDVVVVANFANRSYNSYSLGFPRDGSWRVRFNSDWRGYSSDYGDFLDYDTVAGGNSRDGIPYQANVGVGPYSILILSQDPR